MSQLEQVTAEVLQMPVDQISDETSPKSTKSWDSLKHISLVLALESHFGVKFAPAEIMAITTLGDARSLLMVFKATRRAMVKSKLLADRMG